jgi:hypothetical protein
VLAFVLMRKRWVDLKVSGREIVEQHIEADVEQIAPARDQMIKQR